MERKAEQLRQHVQGYDSLMLLEIVTTLGQQAPLDRARAIVYSMACAELCRRLGLNAQQVAGSPRGVTAELSAALGAEG